MKPDWTMFTMRIERERKAKWEAAASSQDKTLFLWALEALDAAAQPSPSVVTPSLTDRAIERHALLRAGKPNAGHREGCGCGWCIAPGGGGGA